MATTIDPRRVPLFLFGCLAVRAALARAAYRFPHWLPTMGWLALVPGIGFLVIWLCGWRKSGPETFGKPIWWNSLRPVHGALYLLFAYMAIQKDRRAWMVLAADVVLGLTAWTAWIASAITFVK